jgi:O-antigen ligase
MMADKSTWWNGAGTIPGSRATGASRSVSVEPYAVEPADERRRRTRTILVVAAIAVCSALLLTVIPSEWSWESLRLMTVGIVLLAAFYLPLGRPKPAFVLWLVMLISECIFFREGDTDASANAFHGNFPTAAYGEVIGWLLCLLAVLVCLARMRGFFGQLFEGDNKWPTLFAILTIGSCLYAPRPTFSLIWALKLAVVILLLLACSSQIRDFRDTVSFLRFTFWAFVVIMMEPVVIALISGQMFDDEGRMSTIVSPNALSPNAGTLLVLALALYSTRKGEGLRRSAVVVGIAACVIMILAGSKTGISAAILAGGLFYLLCRKFGSAFGYVVITVVLLAVLALATPLGGYFHHYEEIDGAESFSGRTLLWTAVLPAIRQKPVLGHGYLASEFVGFQVNGAPFYSHLHNGFLEALYNSGVLGLLTISIIIFIIPKNLYRVLRLAPSTDPIYRISAGCLALYAFLLINGLFNASFGGKASSPFMLMLALVVVSNKLLALARQTPRALAARAM